MSKIIEQVETSLARQEQAALIEREQPATPIDFGKLVAAVVQQGITTENVEAIERLTKAFERQQERQDSRMFANALARLQADVRHVKAVHPVQAKTGETKYFVVKFHELIGEIEPVLKRHQFTLTWSQTYDGDRMTVIATLQHNGVKQSNSFTARVGTGPPNTTAYQADGACETYCKGRALRAALNITIENEEDADERGLGQFITPEQVEELSRRVSETESNRDAFLKFAGAKTFAEIYSSKYAELDGFLRKKEQRGK